MYNVTLGNESNKSSSVMTGGIIGELKQGNNISNVAVLNSTFFNKASGIVGYINLSSITTTKSSIKNSYISGNDFSGATQSGAVAYNNASSAYITYSNVIYNSKDTSKRLCLGMEWLAKDKFRDTTAIFFDKNIW